MAPSEDLYLENHKAKVKSTAESASLVTGITSLLLEVGRKKNPNLKATELKEILKFTAIPKFAGSKCKDLDFGCGTVNLPGALEVIKKM